MQGFKVDNVKIVNLHDFIYKINPCFNQLYVLTPTNGKVFVMCPTSIHHKRAHAGNVNGIFTTSGGNIDAHDLLNIIYLVAFHDLSFYLWPW